jgi:transposase
MANAGVRGRPIAPLVLSAQERAYLERQVRRHRVARSLSERCRIILRCADGLASKDVAAELGFHEHTVGKWRRRFLKDRCDGLLDEARPGRPRTIDDDQVAAVIDRTLRTTPVNAIHWSIRSMAVETGFSHTTIRRMWLAFGLQPHRSQTFKLSNDPLFVDKVRDIDQKAAPARCSYLRQATRSRYPFFHRSAQPKSQALQMDQICRQNPGFR